MQMEIMDFLRILGDKSTPLSDNNKNNLIITATQLAHLYSELDPPVQANLNKALKQIKGQKSVYKNLLIQSLLFHFSSKIKHLDNICELLKKYRPSLEDTIATQSALSLIHFNSKGELGLAVEKRLNRNVFKNLFSHGLEKITAIYDDVIEKPENNFTANGHVVILTKQMLMPPHAPSLDTLNFAAKLIKEYGKTVMIVATAEASHSYGGAIAPGYLASLDERFLSSKTIQYDGLNIPFHMAGNGVFSLESAALTIKLIDALNPEMILSVSAPSLFAEAFAHRCFTFIYPTSKGLPVAKDCHFHTWDQLSAEAEKTVLQDNLSEKHLFAQHPGFDVKPPSTSLTRAQFSIPEDAFVFVVVGTRLDSDVDDAFLAILENIVTHPSAFIAFAGNFKTYEAQIKKFPALKSRSAWLGFQSDIMAVYNISDCFLNPTRRGGGSGIVYALQAGVPVLSLPDGDAGLAVSGFPPIANYDEMVEVSQSLMENSDLLQQYQDIAKQEAPKFSGRAALLERIVSEFNQYAQKRLDAAS